LFGNALRVFLCRCHQSQRDLFRKDHVFHCPTLCGFGILAVGSNALCSYVFAPFAFPPYAFPGSSWLPFDQFSRTLRLSGGASAKNKGTVRFNRLFGNWLGVIWKLHGMQLLRSDHAFFCLSMIAVGFYDRCRLVSL
jgi:hypothetical protein